MIAQRGDDADHQHLRYIKQINAAIAGRPEGMSVTTHSCRGNFQSYWAAEGGYDFVAEALFSELDVDGFFLEYDDERSGGFEPLRFVPKGKMIVFGLITTKNGALESSDDLKRRIDEASQFVRPRTTVSLPAVRILLHRGGQQPHVRRRGRESSTRSTRWPTRCGVDSSSLALVPAKLGCVACAHTNGIVSTHRDRSAVGERHRAEWRHARRVPQPRHPRRRSYSAARRSPTPRPDSARDRQRRHAFGDVRVRRGGERLATTRRVGSTSFEPRTPGRVGRCRVALPYLSFHQSGGTVIPSVRFRESTRRLPRERTGDVPGASSRR